MSGQTLSSILMMREYIWWRIMEKIILKINSGMRDGTSLKMVSKLTNSRDM